MSASDQSSRALVVGACAGVLLVSYLAWTVFGDVFDGVPRSVHVARLDVSCEAAGARPCEASSVRLNDGRFHIRTLAPTSRVLIAVDDEAARAARVLLVRTNVEARLTLGDATFAAPPSSGSPGPPRPPALGRWTVAIPAGVSASRLALTPVGAGAPLVVEELGFFESPRGLLRSTRQPLAAIDGYQFYRGVAAPLMLAACVLVIAAAWRAVDIMRRLAPWLIAVLCFAICVVDLGTIFSPYWAGDIRTLYGDELILSGAGGNLTAGPAEGARLVQGLGQTIMPGVVQWHRMPGYGWLCALAAAIGRTTDVVDVALIVVVLQTALYAGAVGVFVRAAQPVFGPGVAALVGILIALLPKYLPYTEVDSIAAPVALLVLSALLVYVAQAPGGEPPTVRTFLLINAAFALWFLVRNDVLPGWIVVSTALAWRRWRRLLVPLALMAAIAWPWAAYKRQYRREFNLLPTNTGEVLLLSLCEVPGAFPYECNDAGYWAWTKSVGLEDFTSQAASSRATAAVVRHWATYPVHFGFMVWSKLRRSVLEEAWPGFQTRTAFPYRQRARLFMILLTVLAVAIAVHHETRRSLLLAWAVFLNMPLFYLVFASSGRFYAAAGVGLLAAAVPLLFERGFYAQVRRHRWRAAAIVSAALLFTAEARRVEDWVVAHDGAHYWTPVLDPHQSTLEFVGH